jgi:hypothetical protein
MCKQCPMTSLFIQGMKRKNISNMYANTYSCCICRCCNKPRWRWYRWCFSCAGGIDSTTSGTVPTTTVADIVLNNTVNRLRLLKDDMLNYTTTFESTVTQEEIINCIYLLLLNYFINGFITLFINLTCIINQKT